MKIPNTQNPIEWKLEEIDNYLKRTKESIKNEEYYSPEGYLYCIKQECQELIHLLKTLQKPL